MNFSANLEACYPPPVGQQIIADAANKLVQYENQIIQKHLDYFFTPNDGSSAIDYEKTWLQQFSVEDTKGVRKLRHRGRRILEIYPPKLSINGQKMSVSVNYRSYLFSD